MELFGRSGLLTLIDRCELFQSALIFSSKAVGREPPCPVATKSAWNIHARFTAQSQNVLHGNQNCVSHGFHDFADKNPIHFTIELSRGNAEIVLCVSVFFFHISLAARALRQGDLARGQGLEARAERRGGDLGSRR